jgi:hypothetical protein
VGLILEARLAFGEELIAPPPVNGKVRLLLEEVPADLGEKIRVFLA